MRPLRRSATPPLAGSPASTPSRFRQRGLAGILALTLVAVAAACEPTDAVPNVLVTSVDTFVTSTAPTSNRVNDTVLRVMNSAGKTKIGYASFPAPAGSGATVSGTLHIYAIQAGFNVSVHDVAPFSSTTTFANRPALGAKVGDLARTSAATRHAVTIGGARVTGGFVYVAFTTTSPYELEILSSEGARSRSDTGLAPTLTVGAVATPPPPPPPPPPTVPPAPVPAGWNLTFGDEFNGAAVDASKWNVYDQSKGDSVESPKASTCPLSSNVSVGGGKLVMRTQDANGACSGGQAQSGAGMNTWGRFKQAGGRFEARVRWTDKGNYLWGGFWTHGNGGVGWTKDNPTEIDVFEYIGKNAEPNISRFKPAIHYNYTCEGTCGMQNLAYQPHDVTLWHTYAVEWEPTNPADPTTMQIRFYVDGRLITLFDKAGTWQVTPDGTRILAIAGGWQNPKGAFPNPFGLDRPHQLILSAWVGGPGVDPATVAAGYNPAGGHADLEVDFVRVYDR